MYYKILYDSPIGRITVVSDGECIIGVWLDGQKHFPDAMKRLPECGDAVAVLRKAVDWLRRYFQGEAPSPGELPLSPNGNTFQKTVWEILLTIPYGKTLTYGDIAREIDRQRGSGQMSAQAVGGAVSRNPISVIIPCHRVVGKGGKLTGYDGGIDKKTYLLRLEGSLEP